MTRARQDSSAAAAAEPDGRFFGPTTSRDIRGTRALLLVPALLAAAHAGAARPQLAACASIAADRERLACYDALARSEHAPQPQPASAPVSASRSGDEARAPHPTELQKRWELRPDLKRGTFKLRSYRPLYALAHFTTNTNDDPSSPTRSVTAQDIRLDRLEAKMQFSLKSKLIENVLGSATDVWFGYTQQSYWQAANSRYSSPFRETNYEPEAIVVHPLSLAVGGVYARYAALSFTHQSNGRGQSLSRSWNRVIGELAFESGPWSLQLRPWLRISESSGSRDDNPDIQDFVGRGELVLVYRSGGQVVTLTGRHTLRGAGRSRGAGQLDWAFPLTGSLNGHVQLFSGYGENLIDYNHRQTTVGVGVSFFD